jgi:hypothetical protein
MDTAREPERDVGHAGGGKTRRRRSSSRKRFSSLARVARRPQPSPIEPLFEWI